MKKLLSLILVVSLTASVAAQDKKFQIGLVTGTTINWLVDNSKEVQKRTNGTDFIIGVGGNYMFNDNIGLASGVQFDLGSFQLNYGSFVNDDVPSGDVFYAYTDTDIKKFKDGAVEDFTDTTAFELAYRKFRSKYVTVPIFLKFQTNMIGKFKYYGKFGMRMSFLTGVRMDDHGWYATYAPDSLGVNQFTRNPGQATDPITITDMKPVGIKKGLSPVKMGIGFYGGAEWNFTGTTFLYMELGFNYGITPVIYPQSGHLVNKSSADGSYSNLDVKSNPQHLMELKVGLLF